MKISQNWLEETGKRWLITFKAGLCDEGWQRSQGWEDALLYFLLPFGLPGMQAMPSSAPGLLPRSDERSQFIRGQVLVDWDRQRIQPRPPKCKGRTPALWAICLVPPFPFSSFRSLLLHACSDDENWNMCPSKILTPVSNHLFNSLISSIPPSYSLPTFFY